ncbi:cholesterol oxidase [Gillisia sp. Hel_I_86]|uniref:GMC oxidoreductase n=1 Tax=Gillisia sp. Hel_I_86 TaxID=1249981 RepID=UPI00119BEA9B|nr:GMC oxidoreductase [Gillisia sp. Hel_I_86]TVZ27581.1 cholesterol oxidase [Gillisia sp. Hel_I_86]
MLYNYDYIIIGSGFGGSVSALRLSEKGYKVLVIEKGKWYNSKDFAKTNWNLRKWLWMPHFCFFGIMKLSIFKHIAVISGTGVGGGSLVYANTLPIPKSAFFNTGSWKALEKWEETLKPFYQIALQMLGATKNPKLFDADLALESISKDLGKEQVFERPKVAVYFGEKGKTTTDPYFKGKGPDRTGCIFCGACMTGCRHNAKNTLDKNYLYLAQKLGATILAENKVYDVIPLNNDSKLISGYAVHVKSSTKFIAPKKKYTAKAVIFSGGVLGTIKLLLKLKLKSLPALSNKLGDDIRTNNETLISVSTLDNTKDMSKGVAIGSLLYTDANSHLEVVRYSKGSGFWKLLHLPYVSRGNPGIRILRILSKFISAPLSYFKIYFLNSWSKSTSVLLFMQTLDSTLKFKRNRLFGMSTTIGTGTTSSYIPESKFLTEKFSEKVNGKATSFALEALGGIPTTAHILGGAVMGINAEEGVINKDNLVYGYPNMYIIDGSMISANPGVNPSLSITAIAERAMSKIPDKMKS